MELRTLVAKALGKFGAILLDASRKRAEVLYRLGDGLVEDALALCLSLSCDRSLHHRRAP